MVNVMFTVIRTGFKPVTSRMLVNTSLILVVLIGGSKSTLV